MCTYRILTLALASLVVVSSAPLQAQASRPAQIDGDLCTGGEASGTGLRGAYYSADPRVGGRSVVRVDPRIDSITVRNPPKSFASKPPHTVRWCGWIRPIITGSYRMRSAARGMRVDIGKRPVAGPSVASGTAIQLEAGKAYWILIELPAPAGAGEFSLQWTPPFGATYDIPPTVLFPPVETVEPGC